MKKSVGNYSGKTRFIVPVVLLLAGLFCISWLGIQQKNPDGVAGDRKVSDLQALMPPLPPSFPVPDTIPPAPFNFRDSEEWDDFSKLFEEKFGGDFQEMLSTKERDVAALMREFEEKFRSEDWPSGLRFDFPPHAFDSVGGFFDEETLKRLEEEIQQLHDLNFERFDMLKDQLDHFNRGMDRYEDVLQEQLRKDGYLEEDETINSLEWNDETLKVNGKEIKEADEEKYRAINRQYFNRHPTGKVE